MRVSVDEQLMEADSIFIGHFLESRSVLIEEEQIATQMVFKLTKEFGLNSDLFGLEEIFVHYPGGSWEGQTLAIEGVPSFNVGEKVVILARNIENRLWGLNLALGSFRVVNYGKETLLINGVFTDDPLVSQLLLEEFEGKVKSIKGMSLKTVQALPESILDQSNQGKKRSIASVVTPEENKLEEPARPTTFWLLAFLAISGAVTVHLMRTADNSRRK